MKKIMMTSVAALVAAGSAFAAETAPEKELVKEESGRGSWTLLLGPSWRSGVKLSTRGKVFAPPTTPDQSIGDPRNMSEASSWTDPQKRANPDSATAQDQPEVWGVAAHRTEIYGVPGRDYVFDKSEDDAPIGANLQVGYDVLQGENWAVGVFLRFAGYWNMNSSSRGFYNAGGYYTQQYNDWYVFKDFPCNSTFEQNVGQYANIAEPNYYGDTEMVNDFYTDKGSHFVNTQLRSDLYQIGIGPKITWTPFYGVCSWLEWLDVYGDVEILCNIAHNELSAEGNETTQTDCLIGFGGHLGLVGNITDWVGIYGQIGYEWIDKTEVSTGTFDADIDYSSLVLAAGLQFRF